MDLKPANTAPIKEAWLMPYIGSDILTSPGVKVLRVWIVYQDFSSSNFTPRLMLLAGLLPKRSLLFKSRASMSKKCRFIISEDPRAPIHCAKGEYECLVGRFRKL